MRTSFIVMIYRRFAHRAYLIFDNGHIVSFVGRIRK